MSYPPCCLKASGSCAKLIEYIRKKQTNKHFSSFCKPIPRPVVSVCLSIYICMYVCMYVCVCVYIYIYYIIFYEHSRLMCHMPKKVTHTHTHTHTHTQLSPVQATLRPAGDTPDSETTHQRTEQRLNPNPVSSISGNLCMPSISEGKTFEGKSALGGDDDDSVGDDEFEQERSVQRRSVNKHSSNRYVHVYL